MALRKNINIPIGTNLSFKYTDFAVCIKNAEELLENAYIKITNQTGNKEKVLLDVGIYDKKDGVCVLTKYYDFVPIVSDSSANFIKQGYEYLKTLDEYKDAVDLLDEGQIA